MPGSTTRPARPEPTPATVEDGRAAHTWTLLTSHGRVLLLIARDPDIRLRRLAELAQITERAASGITSDLQAAGYITKRRVGRRNTYDVHPEQAFRHPAEAGHHVGELIGIFTRLDRQTARR